MKVLIRQMLLYGIIGGLSAGLDAAIFKLLLDYTGINEYVINIISINAGIITSFILNCKFNFKATDKLGRRFLSFYAIGMSGLLLSTGILYAGQYLNISVFTVKLGSIFIVALYQFVLNKFITFRTKNIYVGEEING
jgi:putative flippase GtrA